MREHWKAKDRPCPPCAQCGEELYEQFWGNGGWAKAEKASDEMHSDRGCVRRLKSALDAADQRVREQSRELAAMRPLVQAAVEYAEDIGECLFCGVNSDEGKHDHDEDCPVRAYLAARALLPIGERKGT
jgi:hypothetical protein